MDTNDHHYSIIVFSNWQSFEVIWDCLGSLQIESSMWRYESDLFETGDSAFVPFQLKFWTQSLKKTALNNHWGERTVIQLKTSGPKVQNGRQMYTKVTGAKVQSGRSNYGYCGPSTSRFLDRSLSSVKAVQFYSFWSSSLICGRPLYVI